MAVRWVTTNVRFDPKDYADLQRLAAASGNSLAECVRLAVGAYLGRLGSTPEAAEASPLYDVGTAGAGVEVAAVVRGRTLVLDAPLPFPDGTRVWVRCLGEAELAQRRRHRRMIAELLAEFERLTPGQPGPVSDEDKEIYQP
jgi:hypothetical protein